MVGGPFKMFNKMLSKSSFVDFNSGHNVILNRLTSGFVAGDGDQTVFFHMRFDWRLTAPNVLPPVVNAENHSVT